MLGHKNAGNVIRRNEDRSLTKPPTEVPEPHDAGPAGRRLYPRKCLAQVPGVRHRRPPVLLNRVGRNPQASETSHNAQGAVVEDVRVKLEDHHRYRIGDLAFHDASEQRAVDKERTFVSSLTSSSPLISNDRETSST
jgi:hypothetical protein